MASETPTPHASQEQSIKERKRELFEEPVVVERVESFETYLRETPAVPLSGPVKAMLWAAGVVVVLLLIASFLTARGPRARRPSPPPAKRAASTSSVAPGSAPSVVGAREPVPATPEWEWGIAGTGSRG